MCPEQFLNHKTKHRAKIQKYKLKKKTEMGRYDKRYKMLEQYLNHKNKHRGKIQKYRLKKKTEMGRHDKRYAKDKRLDHRPSGSYISKG